ncbi:MAG TPA: hypothetical protein PKY77_02715 [Phycisphaerae bacterium]|nr:hypothetical protein [Phycisphaerae bacterium]HRY66657.1 hypothetical protein [Phycisphaerae bacterium]HSA27640.1 hypothetical protein [Phycisphaerae bacterium]
MAAETEQIVITDGQVVATSPEGATARMPLEQFLDRMARPQISTGVHVLPNGVRSVISRSEWSVFVYERAAQATQVRWISPDSEVDYGPGTVYHDYRISWPYVVLLALWGPGPTRHHKVLQGNCEVFWRRKPIENIQSDTLDYPCLLNASKFAAPVAETKPLSWLCTQHMDRSCDREVNETRRLRLSLRTLLDVLLGKAFNRSSERHEERSWYTEYLLRGCDKRFASPQAWEDATRENPLWTLEVPLISTGMTVAGVIDRMFLLQRAMEQRPTSCSDLARIVFNHRQRKAG